MLLGFGLVAAGPSAVHAEPARPAVAGLVRGIRAQARAVGPGAEDSPAQAEPRARGIAQREQRPGRGVELPVAPAALYQHEPSVGGGRDDPGEAHTLAALGRGVTHRE